MPPRRPAIEAFDEPKPKQQTTLTPVQKGSVYGFNFPFNDTAEFPHPGIVIASKVGPRGCKKKVGVIALAITHSEQQVSWKDKKAIFVPDEEKKRMGLDADAQWVCLFEQVTAFFPDDIKTITSASSSYLGQASEAFTATVFGAWNDYRKS
ncbi:hypothetical protein OAN307_c01920 [Octadecabacter antarcticus 307]|uniref:PemK-like protein n=1 Tax=Octadecabacter antarcticus 307 TaxID=391626 RepID=M9R050_9RHOB|nr:hypothetical protein [Octadecabacter antarcticus]AGI65959.1 hypothetical protein OAN307_c01920 [Octadecabacter antarcticus 307]